MRGLQSPLADGRHRFPPVSLPHARAAAGSTAAVLSGDHGATHHVAFVAGAGLGAGAPVQHRLWEKAAERVAQLNPSLTVHLGNLTADGGARPLSLQLAAECLQDWPTAVRCLPGDQDVCTDAVSCRVAPGALLRFRRLIGADSWCQPVGRWWLVGVNCTLLGSGTESEQEQWDWLDALAAADDRRNLLLCLDRPLPRTALEGQGAAPDLLSNAAAERLLGRQLGARLAAVIAGGLPRSDAGEGWRRDILPTETGWRGVQQLVLGAPDRGMGWLTLNEAGIELGFAVLDRRPWSASTGNAEPPRPA